MVVMILERVPPSLRGELTRWMLELRAGVFVGTLNLPSHQRSFPFYRRENYCPAGSWPARKEGRTHRGIVQIGQGRAHLSA